MKKVKVKNGAKRHDTFRDIHQTELREPPPPDSDRKKAQLVEAMVVMQRKPEEPYAAIPDTPFRVRACYVVDGLVVSRYEGFTTLRAAKAGAAAVDVWRKRQPSYNGKPMKLTQLDVDELDGAVWKLRTRTAVTRTGKLGRTLVN